MKRDFRIKDWPIVGQVSEYLEERGFEVETKGTIDPRNLRYRNIGLKATYEYENWEKSPFEPPEFPDAILERLEGEDGELLSGIFEKDEKSLEEDLDLYSVINGYTTYVGEVQHPLAESEVHQYRVTTDVGSFDLDVKLVSKR